MDTKLMCDCGCSLPVANNGRYEVFDPRTTFKFAKPFGVRGPSANFPHLCVFWMCENKENADSLAAQLNAGKFPESKEI